MNWQTTIQTLQDSGMSLDEISKKCGMHSRSSVHDLKSGRSKTTTYEIGCKLIDLERQAQKKLRRMAAQ